MHKSLSLQKKEVEEEEQQDMEKLVDQMANQLENQQIRLDQMMNWFKNIENSSSVEQIQQLSSPSKQYKTLQTPGELMVELWPDHPQKAMTEHNVVEED